ncbi:hypothetical protein MMPV_002465 [Pyropia vietnamensis]
MARALYVPRRFRRPPLILTLPLLLVALIVPAAWLNWTGSRATVTTASRATAAVASSGATTTVSGTSVSGGAAAAGLYRPPSPASVNDAHWHWPSEAQLRALWISPDEASRMLWAMHPGMTYLEYGSGGSTLAFAPMAARAYSVEHSVEWCGRMKEQLAAANLIDRVTYVCEPVARGTGGWGLTDPYEEGNYTVFKQYVDAVTRLNETTFDVVLIDGRARVACALKVLPYLSSTSTVIIHDARRAAYAPLLDWYDEVGRVVGARGARLLRRKPSVVPQLPLPDATIHAACKR